MPQNNEYMLKQDDAELIYQKKLTAGTNITIDPVTNTISSTGGGGSSVSYAGSLPQGYGDTIGIITIDGTQYPIKVRNLIQGSNINIVQDMTTGNLTISSTAQGTHVEANPSDPATARLSTIEIGSIVYDIHSDNVIIGEQAPSSSQGENGDIYIKINTIETPTENHTCPYYVEYNCCSSYSSNFDASAKIQGFNSRVYATTLGWIHGAVWNSLTVGNLYKLSINTSFGSVPSLNDSNELFGAVVQSYNGPIDGEAITGGVAQDGEFAEYDDETYGKFFYQSFHEDAQTGSYSFTFVADTANPICAIYLDKLNTGTSFDVGDWKLEEIELSYEIDKIYYKINGDWLEDTSGGSGNVADVYVNGTSVLDANDIAQVFSHEEITEINYDNLPSTKYSDNHMYLIKEAGTPPTGEYYNPVIYSEEEREIGVWLDDKPLYQKTFSVTINSTDYIIDLSSLSIEQITTYIGYINGVDGTWSLHFPYYDSDRYYSVGEYNNNTKELHIISAGNMVSQYPYVTFTIQYTKTTDTAGSGQYNHLGVPTVHYSTDEQIIGTWIDGKPLYQKTFIKTLANTNDYIDLVDLDDIDTFVTVNGFARYAGSGFNQDIAIPVFMNTGYYIRIYYISNGNADLGSGYPSNQILFFETTNDMVRYYANTTVTIQYTKTTD